MKHMEIERKFLLRPCSLKKFLKRHGLTYCAVPIEQFYLRSDGSGSERYRRAGDRYIHTVKSAGGLAREEWEEEVDEAHYRQLKEQAASGLIEKTRYVVPFGKYRYELDAFHGSLEGLGFLEVEFPSLEEAEAFTLPEPFSRLRIAEVSENPSFTNGALSRSMRLPTLTEGLERVLKRVRDGRNEFLKASTAVSFGPYEKAGVALQALFFTLISTVQANRQAILDGSDDPERLHQLRVALRKMRVLLNRFPELFSSRWLEEQSDLLAGIMRETGSLRDLEVALEWLPEYRRLLKGRYGRELKRLEGVLTQRRNTEEKALKNFLLQAPVASATETLMAFARDERSDLLTERAETPILPLVASKLKRLHKKCLNAGRVLDEHSSEEAYHRMRIRIKKLRYMLEFFGSILDGDAAAEILAGLKRIQSLLGEHQDLTVQRNRLASLAEEEVFADTQAAKMLKRLETVLEKEARKRRERFHSAFEAFSSRALLRRAICRD